MDDPKADAIPLADLTNVQGAVGRRGSRNAIFVSEPLDRTHRDWFAGRRAFLAIVAQWLRGFGVDVIIVQPGLIKTEFGHTGATETPTDVITGADNGGNTDGGTTLTFTNDTTGPAVPAPTVTAGYYTSLSVPVSLGATTDTGGSGVNASSIVVQRDEVALTSGSCGVFPGSWSTVTLSAGNDTTVVSGMCYRYREQAADNVGNSTNSSPSASAKVDTSPPSTPTYAPT